MKSDSAGSEQGSAGDDTASAGAWSLMSAIAERDFAQSQRTDIVEAKVQENTASILDVSKTAASATSALAERVTTIGAKVSSNEAAFKQETSALADADKALAQKIETVQASSGENAAAIQVVSKAQATTDGKVSSMTTIKAETTSNGKKVIAGLSLGSDGNTSEILAFAQRFAIVDEVSGQLITPFVVSGGQVFINQAVINKAFIQEIILGMTLKSETVDSKGRPLLEINVKAGTFTLRSAGTGGSTLLNNDGLSVYDINELLRVVVGRLSP